MVERLLGRVEGGEEVQRQHDDDERVGQGAEEAKAQAQDAAEDAGREVAVLDVVAGLVDHIETLVELLDLLVALQLVEPAGRALGDRGDLVGDHRDDREQEQRHPEQEQHDHHRHGEAASHPPTLEPLDRGVEAGGQEQRDDDQDQYAADALELAEQPARQHEAETSEEADVEGRVAVEARPGTTEVGGTGLLVVVAVLGVGRCRHPGGDPGRAGGGLGVGGRRAGGLPASEDQAPALSSPEDLLPDVLPDVLVDVASARPSGTSESSPPKPATTSRSDAS